MVGGGWGTPGGRSTLPSERTPRTARQIGADVPFRVFGEGTARRGAAFGASLPRGWVVVRNGLQVNGPRRRADVPRSLRGAAASLFAMAVLAGLIGVCLVVGPAVPGASQAAAAGAPGSWQVDKNFTPTPGNMNGISCPTITVLPIPPTGRQPLCTRWRWGKRPRRGHRRRRGLRSPLPSSSPVRGVHNAAALMLVTPPPYTPKLSSTTRRRQR